MRKVTFIDKTDLPAKPDSAVGPMVPKTSKELQRLTSGSFGDEENSRKTSEGEDGLKLGEVGKLGKVGKMPRTCAGKMGKTLGKH